MLVERLWSVNIFCSTAVLLALLVLQPCDAQLETLTDDDMFYPQQLLPHTFIYDGTHDAHWGDEPWYNLYNHDIVVKNPTGQIVTYKPLTNNYYTWRNKTFHSLWLASKDASMEYHTNTVFDGHCIPIEGEGPKCLPHTLFVSNNAQFYLHDTQLTYSDSEFGQSILVGSVHPDYVDVHLTNPELKTNASVKLENVKMSPAGWNDVLVGSVVGGQLPAAKSLVLNGVFENDGDPIGIQALSVGSVHNPDDVIFMGNASGTGSATISTDFYTNSLHVGNIISEARPSTYPPTSELCYAHQESNGQVDITKSVISSNDDTAEMVIAVGLVSNCYEPKTCTYNVEDPDFSPANCKASGNLLIEGDILDVNEVHVGCSEQKSPLSDEYNEKEALAHGTLTASGIQGKDEKRTKLYVGVGGIQKSSVVGSVKVSKSVLGFEDICLGCCLSKSNGSSRSVEGTMVVGNDVRNDDHEGEGVTSNLHVGVFTKDCLSESSVSGKKSSVSGALSVDGHVGPFTNILIGTELGNDVTVDDVESEVDDATTALGSISMKKGGSISATSITLGSGASVELTVLSPSTKTTGIRADTIVANKNSILTVKIPQSAEPGDYDFPLFQPLSENKECKGSVNIVAEFEGRPDYGLNILLNFDRKALRNADDGGSPKGKVYFNYITHTCSASLSFTLN